MELDSPEILLWLASQKFPSKKVTYRAEKVTKDFIVFLPTATTGKVMLPMEMIVEWLKAYDEGLIKIHHSPREMRTLVQESSRWANQLHSFETHLAAIIHRWASDGL